jgi:hypothetical protein
MITRYLDPTPQAARHFIAARQGDSIVMLNLLRFHALADYSASPELAPLTPISGAEAYQRYIHHTLPYLRDSGGELVFLGTGGEFLIGPESERWDLAMLVRQSSVESFLAFAAHRGYLAGVGHRTAAVADSRLLPLTQIPV